MFGVAALAVASGSAACGNGDNAASPVPTASARVNSATPATRITSAAPATTPTSNTESGTTALAAKLKKEPDYKGLPDTFANCMVGVIMKYGDKQGIQAYIDGKIKLDDIKGANSKAANDAGFKCTELVTATPRS
jgi:hypothetical protein